MLGMKIGIGNGGFPPKISYKFFDEVKKLKRQGHKIELGFSFQVVETLGNGNKKWEIRPFDQNLIENNFKIIVSYCGAILHEQFEYAEFLEPEKEKVDLLLLFQRFEKDLMYLFSTLWFQGFFIDKKPFFIDFGEYKFDEAPTVIIEETLKSLDGYGNFRLDVFLGQRCFPEFLNRSRFG